jgi:ankyrin repeat protein
MHNGECAGMKLHTFQRFAHLTCGLFLMLVAILVVLTWRTWQQVKLDQALILAVKENNPVSVLRLLEAGADANTSDGSALSPLVWKILPMRKQHNSSSYFATALTLAAKGASHYQGTGSYDPVEERKRTQAIIEHLLHAGAIVNVQDTTGTTPLMYAAWNKRATVVRLLLRQGAKVNLSNNQGETALSRLRIIGWEFPTMDADGDFVIRATIRKLLQPVAAKQ